jgi:Notch-like protein
VDINITVGTASPETRYIGSAGLVQLNVSFEVRCAENFYGDDCLTTCEDINCNNGECVDGINSFTCECESGFTGERCGINIDDCEDINCNNGECVDRINGFTCECEAGYTGDLCEDDINDCEGVDCNDGVCVDEVDGFTCDCNPGFTGDVCQDESELVMA